jgi:hypothetical protein
MVNWAKMPLSARVNLVAGYYLIESGLLLENPQFVKLLKSGATWPQLCEFVESNF